MPKARKAKHKAPAIVQPPYEGSVKRDEIRNAMADTEVEPGHEAIAQLAYSLWVARRLIFSHSIHRGKRNIAFTHTLKSCPDTKRAQVEFFSSL